VEKEKSRSSRGGTIDLMKEEIAQSGISRK
jgi:hypothetical protein